MPFYKSIETKKVNVLPDGDYDFTVTSAVLQRSKKDREMIKLTLNVPHHRGVWTVFDYLVFDGSKFSNNRIDQFRRSIGDLVLEGEEVELLPADLINKSGRARLITEEWDGRSHNKIDVYLGPEESEEEQPND